MCSAADTSLRPFLEPSGREIVVMSRRREINQNGMRGGENIYICGDDVCPPFPSLLLLVDLVAA